MDTVRNPTHHIMNGKWDLYYHRHILMIQMSHAGVKI